MLSTGTGALTGYIDVAQMTLYAFWVFFAGLVFYLRREDKREGYPLISDRNTDRVTVQGWPSIPAPKTFHLTHGGTYQAPPGNRDEREIKAVPVAPWPGAPLHPTGDPMVDGVGPASYAMRDDVPDLTFSGEIRVLPIRVAKNYYVPEQDSDPRGMEVVGGDGKGAGTVRDLWVDQSEPHIRYLETELHEGGGKTVLVPFVLTRVDSWRRQVKVQSIMSYQFANIPGHKEPDSVTRLEEDKILGYVAGGKLYAEPSRLFPAL